MALIESALDDGFAPPNMPGPKALTEAARRAVAAGVIGSPNSFRTRIQVAKARGIEPRWDKWRPAVYQRHHDAKGRLALASPAASTPDGESVRVAVIGDLHDDPRLPCKGRFRALGRWAAAQEAAHVVQLGDWMTCDSWTSHAERGSYASQLLPSWAQDLESLEESLDAFQKGWAGHDAHRHVTEGNHEYRCARAEDREPRLVGTIVPAMRGAFARAGWRVRDYGEYLFINGVGFIHHPVNGVGRAYGGKTANARAANEAVFSVVHGHDHRLEWHSAPKIGPARPIEVISAGCALPWGHIEDYARHATTGWWWGALVLEIRDGQITDRAAHSMLTIMERFGD